MKRFIEILVFVFVFGAVLTACQTIQPVSVTEVPNAAIKKLSAEGIELDLGLKVKNPNSFGFNVYKSKLKVTINDLDLGEAKIDKKIRIRPSSDDVHDVTVSSDFKTLASGGLPAILALKTRRYATVRIKGELKVGKMFYKKKFPVDITERVSLN